MQYQLTFGEAIQSVFNKYATFTGRASRSEYWWWALFTFLVGVVCNIIGGVLGITWLSGIVSLALFIPGLAVLVRRLHDINMSGWWAALPCVISIVCGGFAGAYLMDVNNSTLGILTGASGIVCFVIGIVFIVWLCKPSYMDDNQYGPIPNVG